MWSRYGILIAKINSNLKNTEYELVSFEREDFECAYWTWVLIFSRPNQLGIWVFCRSWAQMADFCYFLHVYPSYFLWYIMHYTYYMIIISKIEVIYNTLSDTHKLYERICISLANMIEKTSLLSDRSHWFSVN